MNLWAVIEYITKYAMKSPMGSKRVGEIVQDAMQEVSKFTKETTGVDFLKESVKKFYAKTLGGRTYGIFEAVHLGLGLPLVLPLMPIETLSVWGARRLKSRKEQLSEGVEDPMMWHDNKLDLFDKRLSLVRQQPKGDCTEERVKAIRCVSLYDFYWKYNWVPKPRRLGSLEQRCLMVTLAFSSDCARADHDRHGDYARTQVLAYWLLMPTAERRALYDEAVAGPASMFSVDDLQVGGTQFVDIAPVDPSWPRLPKGPTFGPIQQAGFPQADRYLGVDDLYQAFHGRTERSGWERSMDRGWHFALMEMLVDPVLVRWVPRWVVEQYERWNPKFREKLDQVLQRGKIRRGGVP